jgi:hypothetical protein
LIERPVHSFDVEGSFGNIFSTLIKARNAVWSLSRYSVYDLLVLRLWVLGHPANGPAAKPGVVCSTVNENGGGKDSRQIDHMRWSRWSSACRSVQGTLVTCTGMKTARNAMQYVI